MDSLFAAERNVVCYQDDILVTGHTDAEHLQNLERVLKKISDSSLREDVMYEVYEVQIITVVSLHRDRMVYLHRDGIVSLRASSNGTEPEHGGHHDVMFQVVPKPHGNAWSGRTDPEWDQAGPQPSVADGTLIYLAEDSGWGQSEELEDDGGARIRVQTPARARVGRYQMNVEASLKEGPLSLRGFELGEVFVIFNAWNPDDSVFLDDEDKRREYVLNEEGLLYMGSHDYIYTITWKFAQVGLLKEFLSGIAQSDEYQLLISQQSDAQVEQLTGWVAMAPEASVEEE
uniref:uncharacterized protein n=1 Tax=Myxine glutinosa TaxID=7769 RepID=UPI00358F594F